MISLNSVAIDLIPYTLITLFHSREMPVLTLLWSGLLLTLLVLDYCEIWFKGGRSVVPEYKEDKCVDSFHNSSSSIIIKKLNSDDSRLKLKDKIPIEMKAERTLDHP